MYVSAKVVIVLVLVLGLCASLVFAQTAQPAQVLNYLKNGEFDEGLASPSYWWTYASGNGTVFSWAESGGINDSRYVRIDKCVTDKGGAWAQGIESDGKILDFRVIGYVKGEFTNMGIDGGFYIGVECWSKNWTYLGGLDSPHVTTNVTDWTLTSIDGCLFADTYHISVTFNIRDCSGWMGWDNATFNFR